MPQSTDCWPDFGPELGRQSDVGGFLALMNITRIVGLTSPIVEPTVFYGPFRKMRYSLSDCQPDFGPELGQRLGELWPPMPDANASTNKVTWSCHSWTKSGNRKSGAKVGPTLDQPSNSGCQPKFHIRVFRGQGKIIISGIEGRG